MELYIIRHAQSYNNALTDQRRRMSDPPLTELGLKQADRLADHVCNGVNPDWITDSYFLAPEARDRRGCQLTKLYCSPMYRTLQTALPVARATGLTPHVWIDLHEHGGIFLEHEDERGIVGYGGKSRQEILDEFPNYVIPETITEKGWYAGPGMEDITAVYGRAARVAEKIYAEAAEDNDQSIAIISHGTFIDTLLKALFNQLPSLHLRYFHYNTAMTRIDFHPEGWRSFRFLNRVDHLPAELVS